SKVIQGRRWFLSRGGLVREATPQHGADPGKKLIGVEGLGEVIVRPKLQTYYSVRRAGSSRQHDDRHNRFGSDLAAQIQTALTGKHDVEDQKIRLFAPQGRFQAFTVMCNRYAQSPRLEEIPKKFADCLVIIDNKDVRFCLH